MKYTLPPVPKKLEYTVNLMISDDWGDRLLAEYYQLQIRIKGLEDFIHNPDKFFKLPLTEQGLLADQLRHMKDYMRVLSVRLSLLSEEI